MPTNFDCIAVRMQQIIFSWPWRLEQVTYLSKCFITIVHGFGSFQQTVQRILVMFLLSFFCNCLQFCGLKCKRTQVNRHTKKKSDSTTENLHLSSSSFGETFNAKPSSNISTIKVFLRWTHLLHTENHPQLTFTLAIALALALFIVHFPSSKRRLMPIWRFTIP